MTNRTKYVLLKFTVNTIGATVGTLVGYFGMAWFMGWWFT